MHYQKVIKKERLFPYIKVVKKKTFSVYKVCFYMFFGRKFENDFKKFDLLCFNIVFKKIVT